MKKILFTVLLVLFAMSGFAAAQTMDDMYLEQCKSMAAEDEVPQDEVQDYLEACVQDMRDEKSSGPTE